MEKCTFEQQARLIINKVLCMSAVGRLMSDIRNHDEITFIHSSNVSFMATQMALMENVGGEEIDNIAIGALLHDVGKIEIPSSILLKESPLTEYEYNIIKNHSKYGYDIVRDMPFDDSIKNMILEHHERLDGSGYPDGIIDADIPRYVRYVSVCDAYDAMTAVRPYKHEYSGDYAINTLRNCLCKEYDESVLRLLINCLDR